MLLPPPVWALLDPLLALESFGGRARIDVRRFAGPARYQDQLSHIRIAHITDQHVGRVTPFAVQKEAIRLAMAENPDLVMLTGDFVCHSQLFLDQLTAIIRMIPVPVYAVLGNHDHWAGAGEVKQALYRGGAELLTNQNTIVTVRNDRLQIIGLDDAYTGHAQRESAIKGLRADLPSLALSHIAEEADGLWTHGVPLVLSGHTHGGQVTVARLHEIAMGKLAGHKYVHGLYGTRAQNPAQGTGAVYVGAGIGAAVMPLRLGERGQREVTIFELGHVPGTYEEHHAEQPAGKGRKPSPQLVAKRAAVVIRKQEKRSRRRTQEIKR